MDRLVAEVYGKFIDNLTYNLSVNQYHAQNVASGIFNGGRSPEWVWWLRWESTVIEFHIDIGDFFGS